MFLTRSYVGIIFPKIYGCDHQLLTEIKAKYEPKCNNFTFEQCFLVNLSKFTFFNQKWIRKKLSSWQLVRRPFGTTRWCKISLTFPSFTKQPLSLFVQYISDFVTNLVQKMLEKKLIFLLSFFLKQHNDHEALFLQF